MAYPSAIYAGTSVAGTTLVSDVDHAANHNGANSELTAIETTLGTTAGTSVLKNFAAGDFPARINSSNVLQQNVSGTLDNSVFGTPALSAGTWSNAQLIGTPQITGGTITNAALIGTSQITGGTANNITLGTPTLLGVPNNYAYNAAGTSTGTSTAFASFDSTNTTKAIVTTNSNKVRVLFSTTVSNNSALAATTFQIVRNPSGTPGTLANVAVQNTTASAANAVSIGLIDSPSSGTNTYDVQFKQSAGTTITVVDGFVNFSLEEIKAG